MQYFPIYQISTAFHKKVRITCGFTLHDLWDSLHQDRTLFCSWDIVYLDKLYAIHLAFMFSFPLELSAFGTEAYELLTLALATR
jgi:hypothetical protein